MKKFGTISILTFLILNCIQFNCHSQKANIETLSALYTEKKYDEAYSLAHSDSFKYEPDEHEELCYLYSHTCMELYKANPEINSPYRNDGIIIGNWLIGSANSERDLQGNQVVNYLMTTLYNDIEGNINAKTNSDSLLLSEFSTETIRTFQFFTVPNTLEDSTLYFFGSSFYNDAIFFFFEMNDAYDNGGNWTESYERYEALFKVAAVFFKPLCTNYNLHCDTYKMVLSIIE